MSNIARKVQFALVPSNPRVVSLAKSLRWKPETAVRRIATALPAPMEQQIYLAISSDFKIHPETMAKLLRFYLGANTLQIEDLEPRKVGPNMVTSKFANFAEFLGGCLDLLKVVMREYDTLSLSVNHVANIVQHYGSREPEQLIEMIDGNLDDICSVLGVGDDRPHEERIRLCIWLITTKVIPENKRAGLPDVIDVSDILSIDHSRRRNFRRLSDEYSEDVGDKRPADFERIIRSGGL